MTHWCFQCGAYRLVPIKTTICPDCGGALYIPHVISPSKAKVQHLSTSFSNVVRRTAWLPTRRRLQKH